MRLIQIADAHYNPDHLDHLLPHLPPAARRNAPRVDGRMPSIAGELPPVRLTTVGQRVWQGTEPRRTPSGEVDRSASLVKIARVLYEAGASISALVAALAEGDQALGWRKHSQRADAAEQYHRIVDLLACGADAV